jgi:hypothetical protein
MNRTIRRAALLMCVGLLAFAASSRAADSIPPGTVLPVLLNSTLSSKNSKPGQIVTARLMQDVPLPDGRKIRAGATVIGHITSVTSASSESPARISFRFDTLKVSRERIPIGTHLRAIASLLEVDQAQLPVSNADRGSPPNAWTTVQIGGETVFRGGGSVIGAFGRVGKPVADGVLAPLNPNPERGCGGEFDANSPLQALWVFSSDACGLYGLPHLKIAHAGWSDPLGEITLESTKGNAKVSSGAGMLLRV